MAMKFRTTTRDEPEINLIPFIDVLLVVLIFLMLSTTYSKFTELQITLPNADTNQLKNHPKELVVAISSDGRYAINKASVQGRSVEMLSTALSGAAKASDAKAIIISADAMSTHQAVVTVMEAARRAGLTQITFAAQASGTAGAGPH